MPVTYSDFSLLLTFDLIEKGLIADSLYWTIFKLVRIVLSQNNLVSQDVKREEGHKMSGHVTGGQLGVALT